MALEPTERLEYFSDIILSRMLTSSDDRDLIITQLQPEVFTNENFLIYSVMYNFKDRGIVPDKEFLLMYLTRNSKLITQNPQNVESDLFNDTGDDTINSFITATINKLVRLQGEDHSNQNLDLVLEKFRIDFKSIYQTKVLDGAKLILNDKLQVGYKTYSGQEDSDLYYQEQMTKLNTLISSDASEGFVDDTIDGMDDTSKVMPVTVSDFHDLEFLNKHYGGIKTGYFYNIMAPPKSGKSKFCYRAIHTARVKYGVNCGFWANEGGRKKAQAEMRAIHFDYYYNEKQGEEYAQLSGQDILDDNFPSQQYRELEAISRADLFTNPNHGKVIFIEEPLEIEHYIHQLTLATKRYNLKLIVVDYLQLMGSKGNKVSKNERIGTAYQQTLSFIGKYQVAFISPSQFKQEFLKEIDKGGDVDTRLGGGESAEIVRTPDVNIALYGTPTDIDNNKLSLLSIPSRVARPFEKRDIYVDLGYCFYSDINW
ncbi:DnaB-like helicase C-terminal domain-containing protein [Bacillus cereus]|uniref:DnaB-like helicase C-terminal domain-containing protein n=1 Tax=Bacillus cereus TaxID=1396 RepID=UPI003D179FE9